MATRAGGSSGVFGLVQAQLDSLSPRDRKLLAGLLGFFGILFVVILALTLRGRLNDKASRVMDQKESLQAIQDLSEEYAVAAAQIEAAEKRLTEFGDQPLSAYLEKTASALGIAEELSVNKQQTEVVGGVEQTKYKVDLRRVEYDMSLNFVYDIETSGYPLRVDSARFKAVKYKGEKLVSLTLELTAYTLQESG
jgi:type II secretory pathway component PulM